MEALKIIEKKENIKWNYDSDADVLYISIGEPKNAEGLDIGEGVIARVNTDNNEIVGVTILNLSQRTIKSLQV